MDYTQIESEYHTKSKQMWNSLGMDDVSMSGVEPWDYAFLVKYITDNKPKNIVEYGSGISTFLIDRLITELDYGATFISFEDDSYWYDKIKKSGLDENNRVKLVDMTTHNITIDTSFVGVRYHHGYEELKNTDFVIIDGPELNKLNANATLNLQDMVESIGYIPPYWIDGRSDTIEYYTQLGYAEYQVHSRRDVYEVMKQYPTFSEWEAKNFISDTGYEIK
jgi:hypothetical protein